MSMKEIIEVFVRVQETEYYDKMILLDGEKFAEIVKVGETIKKILRTGKIARVAAVRRYHTLGVRHGVLDLSKVMYKPFDIIHCIHVQKVA